MLPLLKASDVPKEPAIRRAWVLFQLRIRGWSLGLIADEIGVSRTTLRSALLEPSFPSEQAIAKKLGLQVKDLFPERFDHTGRRLYRTRTIDPSRRGSRRNADSKGVA